VEHTSAPQGAPEINQDIQRKLIAWARFGQCVLDAWTALASIQQVATASHDNYARRLFIRQALEKSIKLLQDGLSALVKGYPDDIIKDRESITQPELFNVDPYADGGPYSRGGDKR